MKTPKVAIYYDWLNQWGGAERVLLDLLEIYPQADLFTLVHDPKKTKWLPKNIKIYTSFLQNLPGAKNNLPLYTPLHDFALELFDFSNYHLVISTTSTQGHCLITHPNTLFVCYYHNLNRHLYLNPPKLLLPLLNTYRHLDFYYSARPDFSFCNSLTVQKRIEKYYHKTAIIINPGIDTDFFNLNSAPSSLTLPQKYFLVVSRLVPHKKIELAIKACLKLNRQLVILGTGRHLVNLQTIAQNSQNIIFIPSVSQNHLKHLYQNAQALICPQIEDFGLTPLEALACGTPIIALKKGGFTETLNQKTAQFFNHQTVSSLTKAILKFETKLSQNYFSKNLCRQHSLTFSRHRFMLNFKQTVDRLWTNWQIQK